MTRTPDEIRQLILTAPAGQTVTISRAELDSLGIPTAHVIRVPHYADMRDEARTAPEGMTVATHHTDVIVTD